jgi:hypothetical protein
MTHSRMLARRWLTLVVALAVAGAMSPNLQAQTAGVSLGATGTVWGGKHVALQVTAEGATLQFDCARGTIALPLMVDAHGNFKAKGTFTRERPGPVMRDGNQAAAAVYSGTLTRDTLHLTIAAGAQSEGMGEYVLTLGKPGRVLKCK